MFAIRDDGADLWEPICARLKVLDAAASVSTEMRARYAAIRLPVHVSTRLIRQPKTLAVRAPRFSISITTLLRDNFHIRDGYMVHATYPTALPITLGLQLQFRS